MKTIGKLRTRKAEENFSAVVIVVMLLILPDLGATAVLAGSVVALCVYTLIFKDSMRDGSGSFRPAICLTVALVVATAVAFVVALIQGRWH